MGPSCSCAKICAQYHEKFFKEDLVRELREGKYLSSRLLLDVCDDLRNLDDNGNTPLHLAAMSGNIRLFELVCTTVKKKDPNIVHELNKLGLHCAHLAVCDDSTRMLKILLEYFSFDINISDVYRGWTPLQYALKYRKHNVVTYLISLQKSVIAEVIYKDDSGKTLFVL
ncbi:ankyrin repeat domain-containing protein CinsV3 [Chelonus insularis]|nr:ankyrin repeat domain-containing protein CinsV3 [Chelonus insularis]